jgi:hypothetical protein
MAAFLPFGKAADLLGELLPVSANMTANTVRNRTMKVGKRLQKSADDLLGPQFGFTLEKNSFAETPQTLMFSCILSARAVKPAGIRAC